VSTAVKPLILAALNFGGLVYKIILAPLILVSLLPELSKTLKTARDLKYSPPIIFAKLQQRLQN